MAKGKTGDTRNGNSGDSGEFVIPPANDSGNSEIPNIGGVDVIDTTKLASDGAHIRKERSDKGKPRGSRSGGDYRSGQKGDTASVDGLTALLITFHWGWAQKYNAPELELTEAEARNLATAYKEVAKYFKVLEISGPAAACLNLAGAIGQTYGPRVIGIRARMKREREGETHYQPPPPPQASTVNPAPAGNAGFDFNLQPFGTEAPPPKNTIDFPIIRQGN